MLRGLISHLEHIYVKPRAWSIGNSFHRVKMVNPFPKSEVIESYEQSGRKCLFFGDWSGFGELRSAVLVKVNAPNTKRTSRWAYVPLNWASDNFIRQYGPDQLLDDPLSTEYTGGARKFLTSTSILIFLPNTPFCALNV